MRLKIRKRITRKLFLLRGGKGLDADAKTLRYGKRHVIQTARSAERERYILKRQQKIAHAASCLMSSKNDLSTKSRLLETVLSA